MVAVSLDNNQAGRGRVYSKADHMDFLPAPQRRDLDPCNRFDAQRAAGRGASPEASRGVMVREGQQAHATRARGLRKRLWRERTVGMVAVRVQVDEGGHPAAIIRSP